MGDMKFYILMGIFNIIKDIEKTSSKAVHEVLPKTNAVICVKSTCQEVSKGISSQYTLLLHNDTSLYGDYSILSIRKEIFIDNRINIDKSESYYVSIPRFILAVIDLLLPTVQYGVDTSKISELILGTLNNTHSVSSQNTSYSTEISSDLRQSMKDLNALRMAIKPKTLEERNLGFTIGNRESFSKSIFFIIENIGELYTSINLYYSK